MQSINLGFTWENHHLLNTKCVPGYGYNDEPGQLSPSPLAAQVEEAEGKGPSRKPHSNCSLIEYASLGQSPGQHGWERDR